MLRNVILSVSVFKAKVNGSHMNINLSSVSESPKTAKVISESVDADGEVTESGGFFSKLASLIKGESSDEAKATQEKAGPDGASVSDTDDVADEIKTESTKMQSADELLGDESVDDAAVDTKAVNAETDSESDTETKRQSSVDNSKAVETKEPNAEKIISENDQILQQLDEANRALQPKDGKPLPQNEQVANDTASTSSDLVTAPVTSLGAEDEITATNTTDLNDEAVVPASAQRFVQAGTEQSNVETNPEQQYLARTGVSDEQSADVLASSDGESVDVTEVMDEHSVKASQEQISDEMSTQLATAQSEAADVSEAVSIKQQETVDLEGGTEQEESESVSISAASVLGGGVAATLAEKSVDVSSKNIDASLQTVSSGATQAAELVDPETVAASVVATTTIPWANSEVAVEEVIAQESKVKTANGQAQNAAVAQSVQQALTAQQAQSPVTQASAQAMNAQASLPPELMMNQLQSVAAAPTMPVNQGQALLKAALGANAAANLGKQVKNSEASGTAGESSFAQQIAQASGQQPGTSFNQIRAEQAAAQAPLQLNREMAGDQVAERIQMMMSKNLKNIDIRLDPPELGRLQIRMNMNGDGTTVHFTVANQQARDVIEQSMPRLREMLAQQGVQLGDTSVQQQSSGQQQSRYAANGQGQDGQGSSNQPLSGEENLEPDINLDLNVASKRDGISYYA